MKKIVVTLIAVVGLAFTGACIPGPSKGFLYTGTKFQGAAARDVVPETKEAEGCMTSILLLGAWGNASAGAIAQEAGITRISKVDHKSFGILVPIFRRFCTVVKGS